ncbi:MAG TPA: hypothetical protein VH092_23695 [Urbifossiella sp.]|nr:hypothetical protein [Urbifossiella sp.]
MFSSFKSISKKKEGETSAVRVRRARQAAEAVAPTNGKHVATGGAVELAKQLKGLITQYGADEVLGMVTVLRD